jgi:hypothetical protein
MYAEIYRAMHAERRRQDEKWNRNHDHGHGDCSSPTLSPWVKLAVLTEEVGEIARALLDQDEDQLTTELIQTIAVCHAWLESRPSLPEGTA